MLKRLVLAAAASLVVAGSLPAQTMSVQANDTIEKILVAHKGRRVTLKLGPNDELTGVVKSVGAHVVHLSELAGREFFDAVVDVKRIDAVIVRTKN